MKSRELQNLGVPRGEAMKLAIGLIADAARGGMSKQNLRERMAAVATSPGDHLDDPQFGQLAQMMHAEPKSAQVFVERDEPAPWRQWGDDLDPESIKQLRNACRLPVAVAGALMPDAHLGYGLPIGGVLATDNAVIPYAVGVDIACRVKLSVYDMPPDAITGQTDRLVNTINQQTRFGIGAKFENRDRHEHDVLDHDWSVTEVTRAHKDKAWSQLGSSGSGNHFVEFGVFTIETNDLGLEAGRYLALLSHSGSRGVGASVAGHYSKIAMNQHPELPKELRHLAWLDLDTAEGKEYWAAMNLMGEYAAANHACIHRAIARALGADVLVDIENHHNFAWKETHGGREVIVHRKGATPAAVGDLGVIPGSMADPAYVVRGKGGRDSLDSASHGAGRVMSRTKAKQTFTWSEAKKLLADRNVKLISAGLDEVPMVYKNIDEVMAQQRDLVDSIARFDPKIVKMAPPGERAED